MRTETYDLAVELERIDDELDEVADDVAEYDDEEEPPEELVVRGQQLERQYVGLQWALHPPDHEDREPYESVTLSELTAGKYFHAGDRAGEDAAESNLDVGGETQRVYRVAEAIEAADFVDDGAEFDEVFIAVHQLKPQFFYWLEQRVDDLTTPDVEGNGFAQRVEARRSADESESPS